MKAEVDSSFPSHKTWAAFSLTKDTVEARPRQVYLSTSSSRAGEMSQGLSRRREEDEKVSLS